MFDGYVLPRTEYVHPSGVAGSPLLDDPGAARAVLGECMDAARGRTREGVDAAVAELLAERAL